MILNMVSPAGRLTQERDEIQESQPWNDHEVEPANKLLVLQFPSAIVRLIAYGITYYQRLLFLTLPFIRIREPIERGHLLSMLSFTIVDSFLVRYRRAMPAVAVAFLHRAR